jgi:hypothetical protein
VTRHATTVSVRWALGDGATGPRADAWERLVRRALAAGLVLAWDDGRGRDMWYTARRGAAERALRAACARAVGAEPAEVLV